MKHSSSTDQVSMFLASVNDDNRALLYKCRWSKETAATIVPMLIELLAHEDHFVVEEALRSLFTIGTPAVSAADSVAELIKSARPTTRHLAVLALGNIAIELPKLCVQSMIKVIEDYDCQADALRVLEFHGNESRDALKDVVHCYKNNNAKIRQLVVRTASAIDPESEWTRDLLIAAKNDRSKLVRKQVNQCQSP